MSVELHVLDMVGIFVAGMAWGFMLTHMLMKRGVRPHVRADTRACGEHEPIPPSDGAEENPCG